MPARQFCAYIQFYFASWVFVRVVVENALKRILRACIFLSNYLYAIVKTLLCWFAFCAISAQRLVNGVLCAVMVLVYVHIAWQISYPPFPMSLNPVAAIFDWLLLS